MMHNDKPGDRPATQQPFTSPGRPHTFVVTLLAALLVGLTAMAIRNAAPLDVWAARSGKVKQDHSATTANVSTAEDVESGDKAVARALSRDDLRQLGGFSIGLATLSLLLPRKSLTANTEQLTPQLVAQSTGLPIVGTFFSGPKTKKRSSGQILQTWVGTAESIICIAFVLTLTAYFLHPELFATLRKNPLTGYLQAIQQLTDTVIAWLAPRLPLA